MGAITSALIRGAVDLSANQLYSTTSPLVRSTTINVLNGELHFNGEYFTLEPHDPAVFSVIQLPVWYSQSAEAPQFVAFKESLFAGDEDALEKALLLEEMLGYCLQPTCFLEKFFLLVGTGANGKSVLLNTLIQLIGTTNTSAVMPSQMSNRFQLASLDGKLVNLVSELREGEELPDAIFKALVSGERLTAEHKGRDPFTFQNTAKLILAANHLPFVRDHSNAWYRRAAVLTFNRTFSGEQRDPGLFSKLATETSGIFQFALSGLARLLRSGRFTDVPSSEDAIRRWRTQADQVRAFVDDCCELEAGHTETSADVFGVYRSWAEDERINKPLTRRTFTERLAARGVETKKGTAGQRLLVGIRLLRAGDVDATRTRGAPFVAARR